MIIELGKRKEILNEEKNKQEEITTATSSFLHLNQMIEEKNKPSITKSIKTKTNNNNKQPHQKKSKKNKDEIPRKNNAEAMTTILWRTYDTSSADIREAMALGYHNHPSNNNNNSSIKKNTNTNSTLEKELNKLEKAKTSKEKEKNKAEEKKVEKTEKNGEKVALQKTMGLVNSKKFKDLENVETTEKTAVGKESIEKKEALEKIAEFVNSKKSKVSVNSVKKTEKSETSDTIAELQNLDEITIKKCTTHPTNFTWISGKEMVKHSRMKRSTTGGCALTDIWNHYLISSYKNMSTRRSRAKCIYCDHEIDGKSQRMLQHSVHCPKISDEDRESVLWLRANNLFAAKRFLHRTNALANIKQEQFLAEHAKCNGEMLPPITNLLDRQSNTGQSSSSSSDGGIPSIEDQFKNQKLTELEQTEAELLLAQSFITGQIPPSFIENHFFKKFLKLLRPGFEIPLADIMQKKMK